MEIRTTLEDIAREYGIEVRTLHNALYDAYLTAQIFQRILWQISKFGYSTVNDLIYLAKKGGDN